MDETLTDCLMRVKEDLSGLKKVRDYLDTNLDEEGSRPFTWRTIEAFNFILGACSLQNPPHNNALDTLLDSFYYLARNTTDPRVWNDFGFELGMICVKTLSAIERSELFEILFCKLLTVINVICKHNSNVWKGTARQILNIFINKKFSLFYFESALKVYICMLKNLDNFPLYNFSSQNLHLLKTLSSMVQRIGDFEIQSDIMELIFLHLTNNKSLMSDFFSTSNKSLFDSLQFADFERDCRTYLNALNKPEGGFERKVYSVQCRVLYLGGYLVEPPIGSNSLWLDANRETERLSIRCGESESAENRVIYILFSDILHVTIEKEEGNRNRCLTIQTKSLSGLQFDVKNDNVCLIVEDGEAVFEILNFLNVEIKRKRKPVRKISKTMESLFIDRNTPRKVQDNVVTSSDKQEVDDMGILNLFETSNTNISQTSTKSQRFKIKTPPPSQEQEIKIASQELSPNSFVESLNQHIGRDSPEIRHTFEDSVETVEFLQRSSARGAHKLFRSPCQLFDIIKTEEQSNINFIFDEENKENKFKQKTYSRKQEKPKPTDTPPDVLRDRRNLGPKLGNTQSQDCFRSSGVVLKKKRKPSLPKLKRGTKHKASKSDFLKGKVEHNNEDFTVENRNQNEPRKECENEKQPVEEKIQSEYNLQLPPKLDCATSVKFPRRQHPKKETKPSLLDPNGYAYRRWCEPSTSERSNFWLKKLKDLQKSKPDNVFDFSDDSNPGSSVKKRRKRKVVHSKRKYTTKQTSLKQVKEILRTASPKEMENTLNGEKQKIKHPMNTHSVEGKSPEPEINDCVEVQQQEKPQSPRQQDIAVESDEAPETEEEDPPRYQKRQLSDEDSLVRTHTKKKSKATFPTGKLLAIVQHRLQKREEKDRQQTDEIIQAMNTAVNRVFNHLQRKEGKTVLSYLKTAEESLAAVEPEIEELSLRMRRLRRAMLYFQAGCSVAGTCELVENQFTGVRSALRELGEKTEPKTTISLACDRLLGIIKSEIDRSIEKEIASRRNRLLKCASIFGIEY